MITPDGGDVYRAHIFTSSGTFNVTQQDKVIQFFLIVLIILVVAGGGGGGTQPLVVEVALVVLRW